MPSVIAVIAVGVACAAGCASSPRASNGGTRANGSAKPSSNATEDDGTPPRSDVESQPLVSPSGVALPPLPPPASTSPMPAPAPDVPHVAYRGADPFEPPPAGAIPLAPIASRPPGTDPTPEDRTAYIEACGKIDQCGVCNNWGKCGFCMASKRCVPRDRHGAFPSTCAAGFTPDTCHPSLYIAREEPKLRAKLRELVKDLAPEGMPIDTKVEGGSRVVKISVRRGYCYAVVFRTSYEVDDPYALNAAATPEAPFVEDGGDWSFVYTGAAALTPFCPQQDGQIVAGIKPDKPAKGTWRLQLFRKPISTRELDERVERLETEKRRSALRYVCGHCTRVLLACRLNGEAQCTARYAGCLQSAGVRAEDCERGDVPQPPKPKPPWDT